jgi:hypothetical protein
MKKKNPPNLKEQGEKVLRVAEDKKISPWRLAVKKNSRKSKRDKVKDL